MIYEITFANEIPNPITKISALMVMGKKGEWEGEEVDVGCVWVDGGGEESRVRDGGENVEESKEDGSEEGGRRVEVAGRRMH